VYLFVLYFIIFNWMTQRRVKIEIETWKWDFWFLRNIFIISNSANSINYFKPWFVMELFREYKRGKYRCTVDLLFDWFGLVCFANKIKICQLSYSWFQTSQTGGQWYTDTSPFSIPWAIILDEGEVTSLEVIGSVCMLRWLDICE
jgi:hypothetical protein